MTSDRTKNSTNRNPKNKMQPTPKDAVEELTREAVREVFNTMLGLEMEHDEPLPLACSDRGQIIGAVGFVGQANGVICLNASIDFARMIASRMLGITEAEVDDGDMINDVFGELGNVVVGSVKSRLCDRGWPCTLTIPSIVRGNQLSVESVADAASSIIGFRTGEQRLIVEMLIKSPLVQA